MPLPLRPLVLLLLLLACGSPLFAQQGRTSLLAGYGGIGDGASLGPAVHLNLRHRLAGWDSIPLGVPRPRRGYLPRFEIEAEAFGQRGRSGTRLVGCSPPSDRLCTRTADPLFLVGAGLVTRATVTGVHRPLQIYFLPLTAAVYLRGHRVEERELGSTRPRSTEALVPGGGIGNGLGVQLDARGLTLLLEVRAVILHDLEGGRGGSLPVSLGLRW